MSDRVWIRFCMYTAHEVGERRHPQVAILAAYPDATNLCPESIADAWFFRATPREGTQPKPFSLAPGYGQTPVAQASLRDTELRLTPEQEAAWARLYGVDNIEEARQIHKQIDGSVAADARRTAARSLVDLERDEKDPD